MTGSTVLRSLLAALAAAAATSVGTAASASADEPGTRSLIEAIVDENPEYSDFDHRSQDFDVFRRAYGYVMVRRDRQTPFAVLEHGDRRATALLPTDQAFTRLATELTGERRGERGSWAAFRSLGVDAMEDVLAYHVVPGVTKSRAGVLEWRGQRVVTANEDRLRVVVRRGERVLIGDRDQAAEDAEVVAFGLNRGRKQIGHSVDRVLRPSPLG